MNTKGVLYDYLEKNKKIFFIIISIFFIGMIFGIFFINHTSEEQIIEINSYVKSLLENIEKSENINKFELLFQSIKQNSSFILTIWLLGCTIIGSSLVYLGIAYKGFSLGYTISAIIAALGAKSGSIFVFTALLLQNIIFLPVIFILAESRNKALYKNYKTMCKFKA